MLRVLDNILTRLEEGFTVAAYLIMTVVVLWSVLCRYVLGITFIYGDEAARYLMIASVFIGISIGVRRRVHLGVSAFVAMLPPGLQRVVETFTIIITAAMFFALAWVSLTITLKIYATGQHSSGMHLPMWIIYMVMPLGLSLCALRQIQVLVSILKQRPDKTAQDKEA
ncbi:MAG: TRAP transporter small permease [Desulfarculales bacterium]|jgi:C4-dicarboxylate transporter DctQ subunit|nr:TRAP transporter small permease [Desulfarculales bacterium]